MFDWVDPRTNVGKTVWMVCHLCQAAGIQSEAAYECRTTDTGLSYRERQKVRAQCLEYGEDMVLGSLAAHLQTQNGKATRGGHNWGTTPPGGEPYTYLMSFPTTGGLRTCPVEGFMVWAETRTAMQVYFLTRMSRIP